MVIISWVMSTITIENQPLYTSLFQVLGLLIYILWPLLVGKALMEYLPPKISLSEAFFILNWFIVAVEFFAVAIIYPGETLTFTGLPALLFFYALYAAVQSMSFPGKVLRSIEKKREANFGEYIGDFFLIFFLPIGIWFLQPRINRVVEESELNSTASHSPDPN